MALGYTMTWSANRTCWRIPNPTNLVCAALRTSWDLRSTSEVRDNVIPGRNIIRGLLVFKRPLLLRGIDLPQVAYTHAGC